MQRLKFYCNPYFGTAINLIRRQSNRPFPFKNLDTFLNNDAIIDQFGTYNYSSIISHSRHLAEQMRTSLKSSPSQNRVSFVCENDATYVCVLLACWLNNDVAVPLCKDHPISLWEYFVQDANSSLIVYSEGLHNNIHPLIKKLNIPHLKATHPSTLKQHPKPIAALTMSNKQFSDVSNNSLIIYTSGTTGPPKGVVLTRRSLNAQIDALVASWQFSASDVLLHTLPLHHMHGIVNALLCPLNVGATVVMRPKFNANEVWNYLLHEERSKINLYFAVPTMYSMLLNKIDTVCDMNSINKDEVKERCIKNIRVMTCGSAPLPDVVIHKWHKTTGHLLLERYGMSEAGMILSNPLHGPRIPGSVGNPLPGVEVCIASKTDKYNYETLVYGNSKGTKVTPSGKSCSGDLLVKGPAVFKSYWNKPKETKEAFTEDGWFKTGDCALYENGVYRILGRTSTDIIKSGGYKISALDIECHLVSHPKISDCAIIGQPDEMWGEKIIAIFCTADQKAVSEEDLKEYCKLRLPPYSIPQCFVLVDSIPRNIMGKVNKKELREKLRQGDDLSVAL